jgi:hypothetical protein
MEGLPLINLATEGSRSVLLKGKNGSGKTRTALSFPGPILLLYTDQNLETVRAMRAKGADLHPVEINSMKLLEDKILPAITNRQFSQRTIVLDTLDFLSEHVAIPEISGPSRKMQQQSWGELKRRLAGVLTQLTAATKPTLNGSHPGYHVVVNCHIKAEESDGSLVGYVPSISGATRYEVEDFFDFVFLLEADLKVSTVGGKSVKKKRFRIHTVPPNMFHTCKGNDTLPPEMVIEDQINPYEILEKHWA